MVNRKLDVQVCDATMINSITVAGFIKIFIKLFMLPEQPVDCQFILVCCDPGEMSCLRKKSKTRMCTCFYQSLHHSDRIIYIDCRIFHTVKIPYWNVRNC